MNIKKIFKNFIFRKIIKELSIGKNCRILTSYNNFGSEPYLIKIGDNCTIASGTKFITHDGSLDVVFNYNNLSRLNGIFKYEKLGRIEIGNNVFVGINTIILPNVKIGDNVVVGAGSVLTKDIPNDVVVAGSPAKVICTIKEYSDKVKNNLFYIDHTNKRNDILKKIENLEYVKIEV